MHVNADPSPTDMTTTNDDPELDAALVVAAITEAAREPTQKMDDAQFLADGSRVLFTLMSDNEPDLPTLHFVVTAQSGELAWMLARDVEAGELLFSEAPFALVGTMPYMSESDRLAARLLPEPGTDGYMSAADIVAEAPALADANSTWLLLYTLFRSGGIARLDAMFARIVAPGAHTHSGRVRRALAALPKLVARTQELAVAARASTDARAAARDAHATARTELRGYMTACAPYLKWLAAIRHRAADSDVTDDDLMRAYELVAANMLSLQTPITAVGYGHGLYPRSAHMTHACTPSARATFSERGVLRIEAAVRCTAGTRITLNRFTDTVGHLVRCVQTAPVAVRDAFDGTLARRCTCHECVTTLNWLRASAAGGGVRRAPATSPPLAGPAAVKMMEDIVESTWTEASVLGPAAKAVQAALPPTGAIRRAIARPIALAFMLDGVAGSEFATPDVQAALLAAFRATPSMEAAGVAGAAAPALTIVNLAAIVAASTWNTWNVAYPLLADAHDLVDAAFEYLYAAGIPALLALQRTQGTSAEVAARRIRAWTTRVAYMHVATTCARLVATLPETAVSMVEKRECIRKAAAGAPLLARFDALLRAAIISASGSAEQTEAAYEAAYAATLRHLHMEQLFGPHVGFLMSCLRDE